MLIWIFQTGEPLHIDFDKRRPMRAMNLADILLSHGHEVKIISSSFYHQKKTHRHFNSSSSAVFSSLGYQLISSPGYSSNISFARFYDHIILAFNLFYALRKSKSLPDLCFIGSPPLEFAFVAVLWSKLNSIPCYLDVKDLWPELIFDSFPAKFRPFLWFLFLPYIILSLVTLRLATFFSAPTYSYLEWMYSRSVRKPKSSDIVFPLTSIPNKAERSDLLSALDWWKNQFSIVPSSVPVLIFVGSFMSVFDYTLISYTYHYLNRLELDFKMVLAGDGDYLENVKSLFSESPNVFFPGWISGARLEALYKCAYCSLIPYKDIPNYSLNIPNKVVDSIYFCTPFVVSVGGEVAKLADLYGVGLAIPSATHQAFACSVKNLLLNPQLQLQMAANCAPAYSSLFDHYSNYSSAASKIESSFP
jgi:glycosyltransferase involved in cell wall biosynthesis